MPSLITRVRKAVLLNVLHRDQKHCIDTLALNARADVDRRRQGLSVYNPEFSNLKVHDEPVPELLLLEELLCAGADGAWWCVCCDFQNALKIQQGRHPFGRLTCGQCDVLRWKRAWPVGLSVRDVAQATLQPAYPSKTCPAHTRGALVAWSAVVDVGVVVNGSPDGIASVLGRAVTGTRIPWERRARPQRNDLSVGFKCCKSFPVYQTSGIDDCGRVPYVS
jgi:hypothetical protein